MFASNTGSSSSTLHARATNSYKSSPLSSVGPSTPSILVYTTLQPRIPQRPSSFPFPSDFPPQWRSQFGSDWPTRFLPTNTQSATVTTTLDVVTSSSAAVTSTSDGVIPSSSGNAVVQRAHSGPSTTLILALSIPLGLSLAATAVLLIVLRQRRARRAVEHSLQVPLPYDRLEAGEHKTDEGRISGGPHHSPSGRRHRRGHARDARPSRSSLNRRTSSIRSTSTISDVPQDDTLPQEVSTTVRKGSLVADVGSLDGLRDDPSHSTPEPVPIHSDSQPTSDPTHSQTAGAKPSPRPREPPAVSTTDRPDTVLLRVPVELAHRVMATIAGEPSQGARDSGTLQDSQDSEPPPAYEPRSADVDTAPPDCDA